MSRIPETKPAFFQILINKDFALSLRLPRDFVKKYGEFLPEKYGKLRICTGKTWDVKLKQIDDDHYFTKGWTKFALDLELERSEFLVFTFSDDESTFDVAIYGTDGCEKKPPSDEDDRYSCSSDDSDEVFQLFISHKKKNKQSRTHDGDGMTNTNPKFEIVLKTHQKSRVGIRKKFAEAAGLIRKKKVAMEYVGGSRSNVVLDLRTKSNPWFRLDLAAGWSDFRKKNRLSVGKTYSFEFIPSEQVIQVKNNIRSRKS